MLTALTEIQNLIGWWGDKTFPDSTAETVLSHLKEEIEELCEAHEDYTKNDVDRMDEAADCFILLMQYAHKMGMDMLSASMIKMHTNIKRNWNTEPEEGGHFKHKES